MNNYLTLKNLSIVIVLGMILISGYLSYSELTENDVACVESNGFDCASVQSSTYSKIMGFPVAYLGFLANLVILGLLLLEDRVEFLQDNGLVLLFGVVFFGFLYSAYLVYVQAEILEAFCQWCLSHEVLITLLLIGTSVRLYQDFAESDPL